MGRIRIRPGARADLLEIWIHIAEDSVAHADAFADRLDEAIGMLGRMPKAGRQRDELAAGMRAFPCGNYIIFYREERDGVEVVRVLHGARDLRSILEE